MGLQTPFVLLLFILVAFIALALTVVAWRRSRSTGSLIFALMMAVVAIWLIASAMVESSQTMVGKLFAAKLSYLGISWAGMLWFLFSLEFIYPEYHYSRRLAGWLSLVPLANIALVMTNELHRFVWTKITAQMTAIGLQLVYQHGWWFWVFTAYSYLALAAGLFVLILEIGRSPQVRRRQAIVLIIGMLVPWTANILYLIGWTPGPGLDITPLGFTITGILYAWTVFQWKLFDLVPQAHEFIIENIGDGYLIIDIHERIIEINPLACRYLRLYEADVLEKPAASALEYWPALLKLLHTQEPNTIELVSGGEQVYYLEASLVDWFKKGAGKKAGRILLLRDITRRKKAEESLRASERQYHLVVDAMPVGIALTDCAGRITYVSPGLLDICQCSGDGESAGQSVLDWIHPDDRAMAAERIAKVTEAKEKLPPQEYRLVRQDGTLFWGEITSTPITDEQGASKGLLAVVRDITQRRELERQVEEAERRQRILAEALHDTASALNSTLNFEEVLDRILVNLEQIAQHDSASIALVDDDGIVKFVRWRGYDQSGEERMRSLHIAVNDRETYRWMAETGEPMIISDTSVDERWKSDPAYSGIRSYAGVPITIKGKIAGFINLDSGNVDSFPPDLSYSLHIFADQAAVAIENARLYDATHRRAEEMSILNRIALTMTNGLEMDQILVALFEQCQQVLPIDVFYVALYDEDTGMVEMPLYYEEGQFPTRNPVNLQAHPGLTGEVICQRRTIALPDTFLPEVAEKYPIVRFGGPQSRSYVGVPLVLMNKVVGVISMQSYQPYAYTSEQIRLLETIAIQAAIAVQNARLFEQMKQMAITDAVTLLSTRRHFTTLGHSEVERALRYNRKLGVLMVDIDFFKRVNDTYGHLAGDQVLLAVANTCRQALRVTDIVGRWGGEEYAIILPEADREGAALIAERIRRMVAEAEIVLGKERAHVTVSIGVAALNENCRTLEMLIDSADRAMYAAKQGGKNRVAVAE